MSNHDALAAAIHRLQRETDKLRYNQMQAMREATYLGTTRQQAERNDARRRRITDLAAKIAELHREQDPRTSTLKSDDRERLESLARSIKEAPDQNTFNELVSKLNDFLAKRNKGSADSRADTQSAGG